MQARRSRMQSDIETIAPSGPDNPSRRNDTTIFLLIFFNRDYFSLKIGQDIGECLSSFASFLPKGIFPVRSRMASRFYHQSQFC